MVQTVSFLVEGLRRCIGLRHLGQPPRRLLARPGLDFLVPQLLRRHFCHRHEGCLLVAALQWLVLHVEWLFGATQHLPLDIRLLIPPQPSFGV